MKQTLLIICLAIGLVGCKTSEIYTGGPLPRDAVDEFAYVGDLPPGVVADFPTAKQFAEDLATEANLKIIGEDSDSWTTFGDITLSMTKYGIFSPGKKNVTVLIRSHDKSMRGLQVLVNGDVNDPDAQAIAAKAEEIFARKYRGHKLVRFIRYQGLAP